MMPFEELYHQYFESIYKYTFRMMGQPDQAEDMTQETFLKLYHQLNGRQTLENPKAWLYRVATNICINHVKRGQKFRQVKRDHIPEWTENDNVESTYIQAEKMGAIRNALRNLSFRDRVLLQLYQDGLSYAEIADITRIKKTSVGKLLSRAIDRCARLIEE